jgi:hypothetical protein
LVVFEFLGTPHFPFYSEALTSRKTPLGSPASSGGFSFLDLPFFFESPMDHTGFRAGSSRTPIDQSLSLTAHVRLIILTVNKSLRSPGDWGRLNLVTVEVPGMEEEDLEVGKNTPQFIIDFLILYIPIFAKLKNDELKIVEKCMNLIEVIPGETVFEEGDRGYYVCFVVEGALDVLKKSEDGEDIILTTLAKGRSIGEMAVIDELPRSASVKARTKATLLTLSREKFNYILEEHTDIGIKVLKGITRLLSLSLRKTSTRLVDYMLPLG